MTWHAQAGNIVLRNDKGKAFNEAILFLHDEIIESAGDEESKYGHACVFDEMSRSQQLSSLELVTKHLFHDTDQCLPLTAWSEATLAAILGTIKVLLQLEVDAGEKDEYRRLFARVSDTNVSDANWDSHEEWSLVHGAHEDRFLWDSDFDDMKLADMPPEQAAHIRSIMGISDEYYSSVPPDLECDRDIRFVYKRLWCCMAGTKTIKMTATFTVEVPAELEIEEDEEIGQTIHNCFPSIIMMVNQGDGDATQASDSLEEFFLDGCAMDHKIEVIDDVNDRASLNAK